MKSKTYNPSYNTNANLLTPGERLDEDGKSRKKVIDDVSFIDGNEWDHIIRPYHANMNRIRKPYTILKDDYFKPVKEFVSFILEF